MADLRESSDSYHAIVVRLNDRWRVIDSCESYPHRQWVLQQARGSDPTRRWHGSSYCQTRAVLERVVREKVGDIPEVAESILRRLPARDMGILAER